MKMTILPPNLIGDPESVAMLQAFYSRSHMPIEERLATLGGTNTEEIKAKLSQYYIGYGHASIGDCGNATLFIEGVSLIAANRIESHPLYNGQESSTRYINFAKQGYYIPNGGEQGNLDTVKLALLTEQWISLSTYVRQLVLDANPSPDVKESKSWNRKISPYAYDVARGFLPCNIFTQLSFTGSLRTLQDQMIELSHSTFNEVRTVGEKGLALLRETFPSSIHAVGSKHLERSGGALVNNYSYADPNPSELVDYSFNRTDMAQPFMLPTQASRQRHQPVSRTMDMIGEAYFNTHIDFGSWRDLNRHRRITSTTPYFGLADYLPTIHKWYLDAIPEEHRQEVTDKVEELIEQVAHEFSKDRSINLELSQYFLPLGTTLRSYHKAPLSALIYMVELRSSIKVHPTLRNVALELGECLRGTLNELGDWTELHIDTQPYTINTLRSGDTIYDIDGNEIT